MPFPAWPISARPFTVLILGGSQGAHSLNAAVTDALNWLPSPLGWRFIHQTGAADCETVGSAYRQKGVSCQVAPFFQDMGEIYRQADLLVCRAGAATVAEIAVLGKVAVFIPWPHAADNHQEFNARALVDARAAEMIRQQEADGKRLADTLARLSCQRELRELMSERARALGRPEAARRIVDKLVALARSR